MRHIFKQKLKYLHIRFECLLIWIAAKILMERNVGRAPITSRRDNNDMWYMAEKLEGVIKRMKDEYNHI